MYVKKKHTDTSAGDMNIETLYVSLSLFPLLAWVLKKLICFFGNHSLRFQFLRA